MEVCVLGAFVHTYTPSIQHTYIPPYIHIRHTHRFYLDEGYRQSVEAAWRAIPEKQRTYLTGFLSRLGYHGTCGVCMFVCVMN